MRDYDFSGWATRNGIECSDGRTICRDAFADQDGQVVPLVWNHQHNDPSNVLGHAMLENREDGVYAYCSLNDTPAGRDAKEQIKHGDVRALSIYANKLKQKRGNVVHGAIREVSLVLAGANPGAYIDNVIMHGEYTEEEAIIYNDDEYGLELAHGCCGREEPKRKELEHMEEPAPKPAPQPKEENKMAEKTIGDVFNTLSEEQKQAVYAIVGQAVEEAKAGGDGDMKHNAFDEDYGWEEDAVLSHSDIEEIFDDAKKYGSLKDSFLAHADYQYGISNIGMLWEDQYHNTTDTPDFIKRKDEWVDKVVGGVKKVPFSRIQSIFADITEDDARAKGYITANRKKDEVFTLLKRRTDPTTIYKKQKLDRDNIIDITDFDVVAWIKTEMRGMLDEEIGRAILVGDGRSSASEDKIGEDHVRPIWTDDDLFAIKVPVSVAATDTDDKKARNFIKTAVKARKDYRGTGTPTLYCTEETLTNMLLIEDTNQRIVYDSVDKLKTALRVADIVTVPVLENLTRIVDGKTRNLMGIIVNLADYSVGADKGGAVNMFDDFDIDFNQQKYLIETRCSGALTKPFSALVLEETVDVTLKLECSAPTDTVYGKLAGNVVLGGAVNNNSAEGFMNKITGWTEYSADASENSGYFFPIKVTAADDVTVTCSCDGGAEKTVDDGIVLIRVQDVDGKLLKKSITFTATKDSSVVTKTLSLKPLKRQ